MPMLAIAREMGTKYKSTNYKAGKKYLLEYYIIFGTNGLFRNCHLYICSNELFCKPYLFRYIYATKTFVPMFSLSNYICSNKFLEQMSIGTNNCGTCNTVPIGIIWSYPARTFTLMGGK